MKNRIVALDTKKKITKKMKRKKKNFYFSNWERRKKKKLNRTEPMKIKLSVVLIKKRRTREIRSKVTDPIQVKQINSTL